jgi:hypothetical protein
MLQRMRARFRAVLLLALAIPMWAQPKPETVKAFDQYVAAAEARVRDEQGSTTSFLWIESLSGAEPQQAEARLRRGEVLVEKVAQTPQKFPGGMIHDWVGTAFVPGANVVQVLALVQGYNDLARYYQPEVQVSRLISRSGDDFHIFMRLRKHRVVTVLLDAEYDVHYGQLDAQHWFSISRSTRISEVDGGDHGFLWRLNTYWRFVQSADGVIVQCEAISLTRDIPTGLGWMIGPFVTKIPRESLEFTMEKTREAVENKRSFDSRRYPPKGGTRKPLAAVAQDDSHE